MAGLAPPRPAAVDEPEQPATPNSATDTARSPVVAAAMPAPLINPSGTSNGSAQHPTHAIAARNATTLLRPGGPTWSSWAWWTGWMDRDTVSGPGLTGVFT